VDRTDSRSSIFGIAKVFTDLESALRTGLHLRAFTPQYSAPEHFNRQRFGATGPWSDVFSLALVLFEVVTGKSALRGATARELLDAAIAPERPYLRRAGVNVSEAVDAVIRRALAIEAEHRFRNAGEFWTALEAATGGPRRSPVPVDDVRGFTQLATQNVPPLAEPLSEAVAHPFNNPSARTVATAPLVPQAKIAPPLIPAGPARPSPAGSRAPLMVGVGVAGLAALGLAIAFGTAASTTRGCVGTAGHAPFGDGSTEIVPATSASSEAVPEEVVIPAPTLPATVATPARPALAPSRAPRVDVVLTPLECACIAGGVSVRCVARTQESEPVDVDVAAMVTSVGSPTLTSQGVRRVRLPSPAAYDVTVVVQQGGEAPAGSCGATCSCVLVRSQFAR
jgi:hypothetical protein